jgi:hypothetical protein
MRGTLLSTALFFGVPGMGADYRVKVPNSEGSSSCSLRQGHGG